QSQFATEVHHINGKGEDAGVVYSEMQDRESEMSSIMDRRVRNFHKKYYHLSNMMVTVAGKVDHERLLKIIEATEEVNENNSILAELVVSPTRVTLFRSIYRRFQRRSNGHSYRIN
ncbi:hypothetical protein GCK32_016919, partial [Trichostrongylus colubriformis]